MDTVQDKAASRLWKKLSALRVTLPNDERDVFDQIIPGEEEVTAHRLNRGRTARRAKKAPEVTAHKVTKKVTKRTTKKATKKAAK